MSSRSLLTASGLTIAALAMALAGCGGATVEGEAPEVSAESPAASAAPTTPFAEERPQKPTGPVPSPPPQTPAPQPMPGEPAPPGGPRPDGEPPAPGQPDPAQSAPAPGLPAPAPGAGDFVALLQGRGVTMPAGMDPVSTAAEACGRFDRGEQMIDVSGWLGEAAGFDPDQQGFFLGAAVGTFCPQNFPKLG